MGRPRIRFWQKVLAALVIVGVAPIALVSVVSTNNTRNDLTSLGVTNIRQRSTSTANAIDAYLASRLGDIIRWQAPGHRPLRDEPRRPGRARVRATALGRRRGALTRVRIRCRRRPKGTIVARVDPDRRRHECRLPRVLTAMKGTPSVSDPSIR